MDVKVDSENELISFCGFSYGKYKQFLEFIRFERASNNFLIKEISKELHLSCHWAIDRKRKIVSLLDLSWEQVFMLIWMLVLDDQRNSFIWIQKALEKAVDMGMSDKANIVNIEVLLEKF